MYLWKFSFVDEKGDWRRGRTIDEMTVELKYSLSNILNKTDKSRLYGVRPT